MITLTHAELYCFIAAGVLFGIILGAIISWFQEDNDADAKADARPAAFPPQRGYPTEEHDGR